MAKKSGSKSSRSERRAGRKRAERAREHGLPERPELTPRPPASAPVARHGAFGDARSSAPWPLLAAKRPTAIPTLVKVIGGALLILTVAYLLSRQRDEALNEPKSSSAEPVVVSSAGGPSSSLDVSVSVAARAPRRPEGAPLEQRVVPVGSKARP